MNYKTKFVCGVKVEIIQYYIYYSITVKFTYHSKLFTYVKTLVVVLVIYLIREVGFYTSSWDHGEWSFRTKTDVL